MKRPEEVRRHRLQIKEVEELKVKIEKAFDFIIEEFERRTAKGNLNPIHLLFNSGRLCIKQIEPIYKDDNFYGTFPRFATGFHISEKDSKIRVHETLEEEIFLKALQERFNKEDGYEAVFENSGLKQIKVPHSSENYSMYGELLIYINIY